MTNVVFSLPAVVLLCTACATPAQFESQMGDWIGQSEATLVSGWGNPLSSVEIPNGNIVYVYEFGQLGNADSIDPIRAAGRAQHACRIGIEIENSITKNYEYSGNYRTCAGNIPLLVR